MNTSKERGGGQRLECWQKEYVRTPTRKLISLKCVCLVMCTYGASMWRQAGFVYGGDCHFKHAPGQGNIVQNTMSDHSTKRNKIRKKKGFKSVMVCRKTVGVIGIYSHFTSQMTTGIL